MTSHDDELQRARHPETSAEYQTFEKETDRRGRQLARKRAETHRPTASAHRTTERDDESAPEDILLDDAESEEPEE